MTENRNDEYNRRIELEKINVSLMESRENIRLLLDSTAEAIYGIDMEGKCTFCNKSFLKIMGYSSEEELIGENMHQKIHCRLADGTPIPRDECQIHKAIKNGRGTHTEDEVFWRSDGSCFPVEYYSYPQMKNGKIVGAVVTFIDITERKLAKDEILRANKQLETINNQLKEKQYALEEQNTLIEELNSQLEDENARYLQQKEILQAIIDSLGAGILMVDTEGRAVFINNAWKELFSYLDIGVKLKPNDNFYINIDGFPNTREIIKSMMYGVENGQEEAKKLSDLLGDNAKRYNRDMEQVYPVKRFLNIYSNPCISSTNHSFGRVYVIRDISHQKEVDRLKMELISTVSHELRTPMSSILGFSELLLTRDLTEERNREYIGIINSEARRLTDLINDFLDIQRMESGKQEFSKKRNSISKIIEGAVRLFEDKEDKHRIIYDKDSESDYQVYCDRSKMLRVMTNLISNAVKYTPGGGDIMIRMEKANGSIVVSVKDPGLGIPEDAISKLFTKFYRVDNDDRRKIGGTGLGLAICKEIIKAHGGQIGVDSVYGSGSTFWFTLPSSGNGNNAADLDADFEASPGYSLDLLIVEDDVSTVKLIKEVLKDEGLKIHDTGSGEEALELILKNSYKIILLDIALNGQMSGWDVLRELKNNQDTSYTPIIITSVYENKYIASQNGIDDYLVKPFEPSQLLGLVHKALNGKLNSTMTVNNGSGLAELILKMLSDCNIGVRNIEHSENLLIITLDGEEGISDEQ